MDDQAAYRAVVQELQVRLGRKEPFTALPANVVEVICPAQGSPVFVVPGPERRALSNRPADYVQDEGAFRVARYGKILGVSANEVVVLGGELEGPRREAMRELAIVSGTGVRHLESPHYLGVTKAFRTETGWGFLSPRGVKLSNSTNLNEVDIPTKRQGPEMSEGRNEWVFLTRPTEAPYGEQRAPLVVTLKSRSGTKQQEFMETGRFIYAQQGLVQLRDGRWISIGNRLLVMQTNRPAQPDERLLAAVLNAVKAGERERLSPALEQATEYSPEQLLGLVQVLGKTADPLGNARNVEMAAREALKSIRTWQPPPGSSTLQQTQVLAVLTGHQKELQAFLRQMEDIRKGALGMSPELMANAIQAGYQYFGGYWIGPPHLLHQEDVDAALLDLVFLSETNTSRHGVFRLNAEGRLQLLGDYSSAVATADGADYTALYALEGAITRRSEVFRSRCQYVSSTGSEVVLFFPFQGLGRVAGGKFEWADRSEVFKRMQRVAGVDPEGRIYVVSAPAVMSHARTGGAFPSIAGASSPWAYPVQGEGDLWVYRRQVPATPSPVARLFPVVSLPVMDAGQRVWFLPLRSTAQVAWPEGAGALGDSRAGALARETLKPLLSRETPANPLRDPFYPGESSRPDWVTDLCCYQAGKVSVALTNVPFQTVLAAGNSNSLFGYSGDPKQAGAFLLEPSGIIRGTNLHELAQKWPANVLRAAPGRAQVSSVFVPNYNFSPETEPPTIARTGEDLWVEHQRRLEVYRDGKPLGVASRLTLLNFPTGPVMAGPLETPLGPAMALMSRSRNSLAVLWAVPSTTNIELVRGPERDIDPAVEVPLVNPVKGQVYCPRFVTPPSFWVLSAPDKVQENRDQGLPMWVTGQGDLLTRRGTPLFAGWRLYSGSTERDVPISYTRKLTVMDELPDGKLVCQSAEGVVWLERDKAGEYRVSRELVLHTGGFALTFLGETSREVYLTVVDARQNAYLAIVEKR